jgi:CubicO group peptidase (beta-lactamase class C family)
MKRFFFVMAIFLSVASGAYAQTKVHPVLAETASPEAAGFSSERLKRIDTMLQGYVNRERVNGVVAMLVRDGKIAYYKGFGYDDVAAKTPMKRDAIFRIASQTKAITSVAVMILYEQGKFNLDDPLWQYIPEFRNAKVIDKFNREDTTYTTVPAKREITIRDLLTHTSGIAYAQIGSADANAMYHKAGVLLEIGTGRALLADQMKKLASLPLWHQPGERFTYGLNTDLLGYLVEVISGMSLDEFFRKNIFIPLGMKDTYFYLPKEKQSRLVTLYSEDRTTRKVVKAEPVTKIAADAFYRDYPNTGDGTLYSGGGGLSSTVYDYAIFLQMMLNGGEYNGKRILSPATVRMMTTDQTFLQYNLPNNHFGLGFGIVTEKGSAQAPWQQGSFEWGGMFATTYWADPKSKLVALIYRNVYPTSLGKIVDQFRIMSYAAMTW